MIYPHDIPICWLNPLKIPLNSMKSRPIPLSPAIIIYPRHFRASALLGPFLARPTNNVRDTSRSFSDVTSDGFCIQKSDETKQIQILPSKDGGNSDFQQRLGFNYSNLAMNIVGFNRPEYYLADKTGINPTRSLILPANIVTSNDSVAKQLGISSPNMSLRWQKWLSLGLMTVPRSPDQ